MIRPKLFLVVYPLRRAVSDIFTGILLLVAPSLALRLMRLHSPPDALLFLSCICSPWTSNSHQGPHAMTSYRGSAEPYALSLPVGGKAPTARGWKPTR